MYLLEDYFGNDAFDINFDHFKTALSQVHHEDGPPLPLVRDMLAGHIILTLVQGQQLCWLPQLQVLLPLSVLHFAAAVHHGRSVRAVLPPRRIGMKSVTIVQSYVHVRVDDIIFVTVPVGSARWRRRLGGHDSHHYLRHVQLRVCLQEHDFLPTPTLSWTVF